MIFLGIDPGLDGALVVVDDDGVVLESLLMPRVGGSKGAIDGRAIHDWLIGFRDCPGCAALEAVQGRPPGKMGVGSAITAGRGHGLLEGLLLAGGWRYEVPAPARWQKEMHAGCPGADPKTRSVLAARRLLPTLDLTPGRRTKPHDGLADAGLLALHARRMMQ